MSSNSQNIQSMPQQVSVPSPLGEGWEWGMEGLEGLDQENFSVSFSLIPLP